MTENLEKLIRQVIREELEGVENKSKSIEMIDTERAASVLGLKPQTLHLWRCKGKGPKYKKLGRAVRYARSDLEKWAADNTVRGRDE